MHWMHGDRTPYGAWHVSVRDLTITKWVRPLICEIKQNCVIFVWSLAWSSFIININCQLAHLVVPRAGRKDIWVLQRRVRHWFPSRFADFLGDIFSIYTLHWKRNNLPHFSLKKKPLAGISLASAIKTELYAPATAYVTTVVQWAQTTKSADRPSSGCVLAARK